jgi:hypothetical protein
MTITRDVITDLLPVYESGEASRDTRVLVEEFLRRDAEFARLVKAGQAISSDPTTARTEPSSHVEHAAVLRTRRALRRKSWTLALGVFFTLLPFVFAFDGGKITFFMWRDEPGARLFLLSAAWLWWSYLRQSRDMGGAGW